MCGHRFEKILNHLQLTFKCPKCGKNARKLISDGVRPIFHGTGFYSTDYKGK